jgi:flavin reductase (DIM6/NTAB) family NADH-FMN oxidoreductase RutF
VPQAITDALSAFARVPAAVAVITAGDLRAPHGSTGMAWAEAPEPPLLLTTLRRDGTARRLVEAAGYFGVSLLSGQQAGLTWQFADRRRAGHERFNGVEVAAGPVRGVPLLAGALASFECDVQAVYPFGEQDIVVGRVVGAQVGDEAGPPGGGAEEAGPVIHYAGRLWRLSRLER